MCYPNPQSMWVNAIWFWTRGFRVCKLKLRVNQLRTKWKWLHWHQSHLSNSWLEEWTNSLLGFFSPAISLWSLVKLKTWVCPQAWTLIRSKAFLKFLPSFFSFLLFFWVFFFTKHCLWDKNATAEKIAQMDDFSRYAQQPLEINWGQLS